MREEKKNEKQNQKIDDPGTNRENSNKKPEQ